MLPHAVETQLPRAGGHFCWPLAGGRRGERCRCHVRREICIRRMFAPWKIACDQTLPISLPIHGHDSQANELLPACQACLAVCPAGGYGRVTPPDCLDPRDVPTERSPGPQASPNGLYRVFWGNHAVGAVGRRTPIPAATAKEWPCRAIKQVAPGTACLRRRPFPRAKALHRHGIQYLGLVLMAQDKLIMAQRQRSWPRARKASVSVSNRLCHHPQSGYLVPPRSRLPALEGLQAIASTPGQVH